MESQILTLLGQLIMGGGSVAQVATFVWLWMIHRDQVRDRQDMHKVDQRVGRLERRAWRRLPEIEP